MNRHDAVKRFQSEYTILTDIERDDFARLANRLLQVNYFVEKKKGNNDDYAFLSGRVDLFAAYFSLIDIEIGSDKINKVIYLKNKSGYNKLKLNKLESVILLALRILFQKGLSKVTLNENIDINFSDLGVELIRTKARKDQLKNTEAVPILRKFRQYNLIDFIGTEFSGGNDVRITILPSILMAVNYEDMSDLLAKYESYKKGDAEENEETDEDQAD